MIWKNRFYNKPNKKKLKNKRIEKTTQKRVHYDWVFTAWGKNRRKNSINTEYVAVTHGLNGFEV